MVRVVEVIGGVGMCIMDKGRLKPIDDDDDVYVPPLPFD